MAYKRIRKGKVQWLAEVRVMVQGRMVRKTKICSSKTEALKWELEIKENLQKQNTRMTNSEFSVEQEPTCAKWATAYLEFCQDRVTPRVWQEKKDALERFFKGSSPDMLVKEITSELAMNKLKKRRQETTGYQANKDLVHLKAAWNWGQKYLSGWPQVPNPFNLPKFPYKKWTKYVPPIEDVEKVLDVMRPRDKTMLLFLLHTGARKNEVFNLKWKDVDFANNQVWLTTRKRRGGMEERDTVPLTSELRQALLNLRAESGQYEHVFVTKEGKPYKDRSAWLPRACKKAGVKTFRFHAIRHLTASWLDAHNVPLTTIQRILRHRNPHTTARYLHELRGVQVDLDAIFSRKKPAKILEFKKEKASNE
ncbi:site-specific integrase [Desulfohalobiaceae bacterium Ax17]|uniref:tyrosine-type recombinase/integrase n=1 Tax=Desulfovulcanus ferrireducens TaxID=2831190 RepID=UPI00207BB0A1|nr:site-specific integrase [Desulfovulcanus ferrireducens]MBT8763103.1 site-specific integrase [Desulfovulcanus ferrireducens]